MAALLPAAARAGAESIYLRETFEGATPDGRVLPTDTTGVFPPRDVGEPNGSTWFAHDQGIIAAGLAGSKLGLRAVDSAEAGSGLRADWNIRGDATAPAVVRVQFDVRLTGLAPSERVKNLVPLTCSLRDMELNPFLITIIQHDADGNFAVRTRVGSNSYEDQGQSVIRNDRDYRFAYLLNFTTKRFNLTVTDLSTHKAVIETKDNPLASNMPADARFRNISIGFGSPDFASKAGAANESVTFDNLLVCDPGVKDGLPPVKQAATEKKRDR